MEYFEKTDDQLDGAIQRVRQTGDTEASANRTAELTTANEMLRSEINERMDTVKAPVQARDVLSLLNPSPRRRYFVKLTLFGLLLILIAVGAFYWLGDRNQLKNSGIQKKSMQFLIAGIEKYIRGKSLDASRILTDTPDLEAVVSGRLEPDAEEILSVLVPARKLLSASIVYVMDKNGTVTACTPYGNGETLTGKTYAFRPYFQKAMDGNTHFYPALGVTTFKRGLYFSMPINSHGKVIGVVVIKYGLEEIDQILANTPYPTALIVDHGIVFASNKQEWLYHSAFPIDEEKRAEIMASGQFADKPIGSLPFNAEENPIRYNNTEYSVGRKPVGFKSWEVLSLIPTPDYPIHEYILILAGLFTIFGIFAAYLAVSGKKRELTAAIIQSCENLRDAEKKYRSIFENALDGIFQTTVDGGILTVNPALARLLGYDSPEDTMQSVKNLGQQIYVDQAKREELVRLMKTHPHVRDFEYKAYKKDGNVIDVSVNAHAVKDENGNVLYFEGILRDITHKKYLEELKIAKDTAIASDKAKSEFLAAMSHEVRTPMNAIIGMSELLSVTEMTVIQRDYVDAISISANALLTVLNDILDFSKINAGKLVMESVRFNLREVAEQVGQLLADRAGNKGVEILVRYPPNLPEVFLGDPTRIRQILTNLADNAVKFTENGHILIEIACVETNPDRRGILISVKDTGMGVSEKSRHTIFDKFSQTGESITRKFGGSGLGLAICKQLVEMMGGTIWLESALGKGSTFFFRIDLPCDETNMRNLGFDDALSKARVLVADGNPINRSILTEYLRAAKIPCDEAENTADILTILKRAVRDGKPFGIVLIDCHIPETNGIILAESIRNDPEMGNLLLVLLLSAKSWNESDLATRSLFDAFLSKPIRMSLFSHTLSELWKNFTHGVPTRQTGMERRQAKKNAAPSFNSEILLVEDNSLNQRVAIGLLSRYGCRPDIADNGKNAVERFRQKRYDLIFMDVHMPIMDGIQATKAIREIETGENRVPIIAMTAMSMDGDREKCIEAGMNDYISKPVKPMAILDTLCKYCAESWAEKPLKNPDETVETKPHQDHAIPVLNPEQLNEVCDGEATIIREIVDAFLTDIDVSYDELCEAFESRIQAKIAKSAHSLSGLSANIGGEKLRFITLEIEKQALDGRFDSENYDLFALETELKQLKHELIRMDWESFSHNTRNDNS